MACVATTGGLCTCTFGAAPTTLNILPANMVNATTSAGTIMDKTPLVNLPTFGMCSSPANPTVAAATAAALGVLTPMPCIPALAAPWAAGRPTILLKGNPILTNDSTLVCTYGGAISFSFAGQVLVMAS